MPRYDYQGFDQAGQTKTGQVEAASANEAVGILARSGLRVQKVSPALDQAVQGRVSVGVPPMQGGVSGASVGSGRGQGGQASVSGGMVSRAVSSAHQATQGGQGAGVKYAPMTYGVQETMFLRDIDLFLVFAQLANLFRAGITPAEAFEELARRKSVKPFMQKACREIARQCAGGSSLAEAMGKYPDLFPPGAVGAVRAGEEGGYLWEACEMYSQNQQKASGMRRIFKFVSIMLWSTVLTVPVFLVLREGIRGMMGSINDTSLVPLEAYGEGLTRGVLGPWGFLFLVMLVLYFVGWRIFGRRQFLALRHRVAARSWGFKKRAVADSQYEFVSHLQRLSRAGISPMRSYVLAADAVPNRYYAEALLREAQGAGESMRLSTLLYRGEIFPQEYVPLIETGEMTGQLEGALANVGEAAENDRRYQEGFMKWKAAVWVGILVIGGSVILSAVLSRTMFDEAWKAIFDGVDF